MYKFDGKFREISQTPRKLESFDRKLRNSSISTQMKSLESCDWVVLEEEENVVKGAAGMGGMFHVSGIQIHEKFRGKGIGKILQKKLIDESERKGYSFITVFNDPRNTTSVYLHDSLGYEYLFNSVCSFLSNSSDSI